MAEAMRANVARLLEGIDRYNPENLHVLERYVETQAAENVYDLEANLAVLKLYQFNPGNYKLSVAAIILLKSLTNLPYNDFNLCKCLIDAIHLEDEAIQRICEMGAMLEMCQFTDFWHVIGQNEDLTSSVTGFEDSIRKFICHVISITYQTLKLSVLRDLLGGIPEPSVRQWAQRYGWKEQAGGELFIANQEENIKTKNIQETITFESVAAIMANAPSAVSR